MLQVKSVYVNFLSHCYIDTEVEVKEIYTSPSMWNLFENFLVDMGVVSTRVLLASIAVICLCLPSALTLSLYYDFVSVLRNYAVICLPMHVQYLLI